MTDPSGDNTTGDNTNGDKMDSLSWPDPSRPIISNHPGFGGVQAGPPPPMGHQPTYRRPRWPKVVTILLIVMVLVGAMGIWIL